MAERESLVFVEVKTRAAQGTSVPAVRERVLQNITAHKQEKLRQLTFRFLNMYYPRGKQPNCRLDVIGLIVDRQTKQLLDLQHLRGAV